ncbi:MAG: DEAD/DEAH box helicase [Bacteroidales bacterium]|jgi:ATP-dependent RNA helicase DeaD
MINFEEMGFTPGILKSIEELGFDSPMPVQEKVIPLMLDGERDIIALAQTGTGKTAAFGLPLVMTTDTGIDDTQALILCPTRELCMQITEDLNSFAKHTGQLKILAVYGGASIEQQIKALKKGAQIIVATPGRLIDLIGRKAAKLEKVHTVVLDEADEMLDMGFVDSINEILEEVPEGRRTLLFSATMSNEVASIAKNYMIDPLEIIIGTKNASATNVSHGYFLVQAKDKYKVLKRIADYEPEIYGIVFCRTRKETQEIASKLINDGYNADALHGDLSQAQRDTVMQKFRVRNLQLLVATDVAARGLDVDNLTHVINYSLPDDIEIYTHRCGRTGRAGKTGISLSLVHLRERQQLRKIEKKAKTTFEALPIPSGRDICYKQLMHWVKKVETVATKHQEIEKLLPEVEKRLSSLDREELLSRVISLQFDKFLSDYRNGEEIISPVDRNFGKKEQGKKGNERDVRSDDHSGSGNYIRYFINLGKSDGLFPEQLIGLINNNTKGKKVALGKIDLMKNFSFFEMDADRADEVIPNLNNAMFNERKVVVEESRESENRKQRQDGGKKDWKEYPDKKKKKSGGKDDWFYSWIDQRGIKDEFRYETGKPPYRKNSGQGKSNKTSVDRYGKKKTNKKRK